MFGSERRSRRRVKIELSEDEALVLFEWLHRLEEDDEGEWPVQYQAESVALLRLSGRLESILTAPFRDEYDDLVQAARKRLEAGE